MLTWFKSTSTPVEVEPPPLTPAEERAEIERECAEAGRQLKVAVDAEHAYDDAHPQHPFRFRAGDSLYVQTRVDNLQRQQLQRDVRNSLDRWNKAWRQRAMSENPGLVL